MGIACLLIYTPIRHFFLSKDTSYAKSVAAYPLFVFLVIAIMITFLLFKGFKRLGDLSEANPGFVVLIGIGCGALFALIAYFALVRTGIVTRYAEQDKNENKNDIEMDTSNKVTSSSNVMDGAGDVEQTKDAYPDLKKEEELTKDAEDENKLKYVGDKLKFG